MAQRQLHPGRAPAGEIPWPLLIWRSPRRVGASFHAPRDEPAHFELAQAAWRLHRAALAERQARAALALDPQDAAAHYLLARILVAAGRTRAAAHP